MCVCVYMCVRESAHFYLKKLFMQEPFFFFQGFSWPLSDLVTLNWLAYIIIAQEDSHCECGEPGGWDSFRVSDWAYPKQVCGQNSGNIYRKWVKEITQSLWLYQTIALPLTSDGVIHWQYKTHVKKIDLRCYSFQPTKLFSWKGKSLEQESSINTTINTNTLLFFFTFTFTFN